MGWYGQGHIRVIKADEATGKPIMLASSFDLNGARQTADAMGGEAYGITVTVGAPEKKTQKYRP